MNSQKEINKNDDMCRIVLGTKANVPYAISFTITNSLQPRSSPVVSIMVGSQVNSVMFSLDSFGHLDLLVLKFSHFGQGSWKGQIPWTMVIIAIDSLEMN